MSRLDAFVQRLRTRKPLWKEQSHGLDGLDLKVREYVLPRKGGYFVEAGANDGIAQSNTLLLERKYRWSGLLIEPIPELADRCRTNRPGCIVHEAALVSKDWSEAEIAITYCNLMSVVDGSMSDKEQQLHLKAGADIQNVQTYRTTVPAQTLSGILDEYGIQHVDFLSLDVEGFEGQALSGIDFSRHRPTFILVEARYPDTVDNVLKHYYQKVTQLSHHDVLYRLLAK